MKHFSPLEIRSADGDPLASATQAVEELRSAVEQHKAATNERLESELRSIREAMNAIDVRTQRINAGGAPQNKDAELERRSFNSFVRKGREALSADEVRSLRVSDDTAGGYLAPEQFVNELDRNLVLFSPVRSVARVASTGAGAVLIPKRTGGMTAQWVGETNARPDTTVTFGQSRYPVCELACWVDVSNAMLDDSSFDVPSLLAFEFAEEFGVKEGEAFVNGGSVLSPAGFMQNADIGYTASGSSSTFTADSLIGLYHAIKAPYRGNAVWAMNSSTVSACRKLKDSNGNYLLSMSGINGAPATTILGRPVVEMPDMPDVGSGAFPIVFGDFGQGYRIFDRISLSVLRDPYSQATNGMTRFHGRRRVAAGVGKAEALRKLKIATS